MVTNFYDKYLILTFSHLHTIFYKVRNPTNLLSNVTDHQVVTILREVLDQITFSLQQDSSRNLGLCPLCQSSKGDLTILYTVINKMILHTNSMKHKIIYQMQRAHTITMNTTSAA